MAPPLPVRRPMPPPSANEDVAPPRPSPEILAAMQRQKMEQAARAKQTQQNMRDAETAREVRAAAAAKKAEADKQLQQKMDAGYRNSNNMKAGGKIGKYQRYGSNTKKFAAGGSTDDGELSLDGLSLSEARNVARNMVEMNGDPSLKHFTWRGKKYPISGAAAAAPKPAPKKEEAPKAEGKAKPFDYFGPSRMTQELRDSPRFRMQRKGEGYEDFVDPTGSKRAAQKARDDETTEGLAKAMMGPIAAGGTQGALGAMGGGLRGVRMARAAGMQEDAVNAASAAKRAAARKTDEEIARKVEAASDRRTRGLREQMRQEANRDRAANSPGIIDWRRAPSDYDLSGVIGGYKRGGGVKKYARGGGIEIKGKTKGKFR